MPAQPTQLRMMRVPARFGTLPFLVAVCALVGSPVRIMPVGDSITAGEHYKFPPLEERTGFRKPLYDMLTAAGYEVDFVGSQEHGIRPETAPDWFDWNCEAYPGWTIPRIAEKMEAALEAFEPDILLVHVGTNGKDWEAKPGQVADLLDRVNAYAVSRDRAVTVLLCLIINRFESEDPAPTTQFNREVATMVKERTGDRIKVVLVDMEHGAGLDYSDRLPDPDATPPDEGGDMLGTRYPGVALDRYHPNEKGNAKMARKILRCAREGARRTSRAQIDNIEWAHSRTDPLRDLRSDRRRHPPTHPFSACRGNCQVMFKTVS